MGKANRTLSKTKIGGIIQNERLALIRLSCNPSEGNPTATLLIALGDAGLNIQFFVQSMDHDESDLSILCVDQDDFDETMSVIRTTQAAFTIRIDSIDPEVCSIGVYGPDFRIRSGLAGALLNALQTSSIPIRAISTSLSTFTAVIPSARLNLALQAINQVFELP